MSYSEFAGLKRFLSGTQGEELVERWAELDRERIMEDGTTCVWKRRKEDGQAGSRHRQDLLSRLKGYWLPRYQQHMLATS